MVTDSANIITAIEYEVTWAFDWHIYIQPWPILKINVKSSKESRQIRSVCPFRLWMYMSVCLFVRLLVCVVMCPSKMFRYLIPDWMAPVCPPDRHGIKSNALNNRPFGIRPSVRPLARPPAHLIRPSTHSSAHSPIHPVHPLAQPAHPIRPPNRQM